MEFGRLIGLSKLKASNDKRTLGASSMQEVAHETKQVSEYKHMPGQRQTF